VSDRKSIVLDVIRKNPLGNQLAISREVKARTGKGVAFPQLKRLREAVAEGNFGQIYEKMFAGKEPAATKRGPGRPRKDGSPAQPRKERGERRGRNQTRGRRRADLNKIQLDEFSQHLVVCRGQDGMHQATFKSRARAEAHVRELIDRGCPANRIAYYRLNPIKTKITVKL
jgi:hypothetical protein